MPTFFDKKLSIVTQTDLEFLIKVFNQMDVNNNRQINLTMNFISTIQKLTVGELNQYDCKENAIIISVLQVASS
jgi:hypothetical protein